MKLKLADYVMSWIYNKGIKTVFTVSGGGSIFLCDSLANSKNLNYVCCHHEQSVAFAAEGYSRSSKNIGVCLVTTGPGGTNTLTGIAGAWIDSVPLICISGQAFLSQTIGDTGARQIGVQESDMVSMATSVTKFAKMIKDPIDILDYLEEAFFLATTGRPGPVLLDIPANIQNAIIDTEKLHKNFQPKLNENEIDKKLINLVLEKLTNAKRPIIHIGHGTKKNNCYEKIINFSFAHKIPIMTTWNATGFVSDDNEYFIGRPGAFAERGANFNIQNCDFYMSIGSRLPFMVTGYNKSDFARNAFKIMVDIDVNELNKNKDMIDLCIESDAEKFIKTLQKSISPNFQVSSDWIKFCQRLRNKYPIIETNFVQQNNWVYSYYFIEKLSEVLDENTNVITDMGLSFVGTHQGFKVKKGQKVITNSGHAPMGWGLPAAIGSYYADNNKQIICITGEGGLMMNIQELATIMHHQIPIKIFIYNNGGYQTIKETQTLSFQGRLMGCNEESGISFPDFSKVADSYSIQYYKLKNNYDVENNISDILQSNLPSITEIMIDPDQLHIPRAINKKDKDGNSLLGKFEDLYPFLSEKELRSNLLD